MVEFDFKTLEHRLRELAFLNSGVRIHLRDLRHPETVETELLYEGGLAEFVRYLDSAKTPLIGAPIYLTQEKDGITVEVAMWWNDSYHENVLAFTNNIPQRDGGTHLAGYRAALTRQVAGYAESLRHTEAREGDALGRGYARRPHLRALGESPRPEIFEPDQGQAGLVRSPPRRRKRRQRQAPAMVRRASRTKPAPSSARSPKPPPPAKPRARRAS